MEDKDLTDNSEFLGDGPLPLLDSDLKTLETLQVDKTSKLPSDLFEAGNLSVGSRYQSSLHTVQRDLRKN